MDRALGMGLVLIVISAMLGISLAHIWTNEYRMDMLNHSMYAQNRTLADKVAVLEARVVNAESRPKAMKTRGDVECPEPHAKSQFATIRDSAVPSLDGIWSLYSEPVLMTRTSAQN